MANQLQNEKSPYLLQHAQGPIDWYPWGVEAFERAETEDKPILLSIGYSACYWCHTMATESFSDLETAKLINRSFIPIKVDREERPDVDATYMNVCHAMTGSGGWPLNLLLTPSKKPFFAGTYYPKEDTGDHVGFKTILKNAADAWASRRQEVVDTAGKITDALNREQAGLYKEGVNTDIAEHAVTLLEKAFDKENGGFGEAPKFPMTGVLLFLLEYGRKNRDAKARAMAEKTLQKMHDGGLCDLLGGGFFRYATDAAWHRPHYEKMLYDNALLAIAYTEAGGSFLPYAEETLIFLQHTMQSPDGGFYSAVSATTSEGEGAYYLWDASEVREILGKESRAFCHAFHISEKSLPYVERTDTAPFANAMAALSEARRHRVAPEIDRKILTGQNALTAVAFAVFGQATQKPSYVETAKGILRFLNTELRNNQSRLLGRYFAGKAGVNAFSEDYAYLMWAQLALYDATGEDTFLQSARETWADVVRLFWDERGGVYFSARDSEKMIVRLMEGYDGATPSANAVFAYCLGKLYRGTGDIHYKEDMQKIFDAFGGQINENPTAFCFMLYAMLHNR